MSRRGEKSSVLSRLKAAIFGNHKKNVSSLIKSMKACEADTVEAFLLLCDALHKKNSVIAKLLLDKGVKFELTEEQYRELPFPHGRDSPLNIACKIGDKEIVKMLLDKGADINFISKSGFNALSTATKYGHENISKYLLEKGAAVNCPDSKKATAALYAACEIGNLEFVKLLLSSGANINYGTENDNGELTTPLCIATQNRHYEIVKLLVEKGAQVNNLADEYACGYSALHLASSDGNEELVKLFLSKGADVNYYPDVNIANKLCRGYRPIHRAAINGHINIIQLLLEAGASVDVKASCSPYGGGTCLHIACSSGNKKLVKYLLGKGADIDSTDDYYETPLHKAVENNRLGIAKFLIDKGASLNMTNNQGDAAIHIACRASQDKIIRLLLKKGQDVKVANSDGCLPLHVATQCASEKVIKLLLKKGADVNCTDSSGNTPLHDVSKYLNAMIDGDVDIEKILDLLVKKGGNIDAKNSSGDTPLHVACRLGYGCESFARAVLNHGANINEKNNYGFTPLQMAVACNGLIMPSPAMIGYLIVRGADCESKENTKKTALHMAYMLGRREMFEKLLDFGADINNMYDPNFLESIDQPIEDEIDRSLSEHEKLLLLMQKAIAKFKWVKNTMETLIKHIIKLKSLNLPINEQMFGHISLDDPKSATFFKKCEEEITKLKNEKLDAISLYSILTKPVNCVSNYLMNKNIINKLKLEKNHEKYPIFGKMLDAKCKVTNLRVFTCLTSFSLFDLIFKKKIPSLVINKIMEYLSTEDLTNFIRANNVPSIPDHIDALPIDESKCNNDSSKEDIGTSEDDDADDEEKEMKDFMKGLENFLKGNKDDEIEDSDDDEGTEDSDDDEGTEDSDDDEGTEDSDDGKDMEVSDDDRDMEDDDNEMELSS